MIGYAAESAQLLKDYLANDYGLTNITPESCSQAADSNKQTSIRLKNSALHFSSSAQLDFLECATNAAERDGLEIQWLYILSSIEPASSNDRIRYNDPYGNNAGGNLLFDWLEFNTGFLDHLDELDCFFIGENALLSNREHYFDLIRERLETNSINMPARSDLSKVLNQRELQTDRHNLATDISSPDNDWPFRTGVTQNSLVSRAFLEKIPAENQDDRLTEEDKILASIQNSRRHAAILYDPYSHAKSTVIYISEDSHSRGHIYRVSQMIQGLHFHGLEAFWMTPSDALNMQHLLDRAMLVVMYRCSFSKEVKDIYAHCRRQNIRTAFDIDDYLFDMEIVTSGDFHYYSLLKDHEQLAWRTKVEEYRSQAILADYCIVPTNALARAMLDLNSKTIVSPNAYSPITARLSNCWAESREGSNCDHAVLGYMSGTPTHDADFSQIAATVFRLLRSNPNYILRIVGHLNLKPYSGQYRLEQVEFRPLVEHVNFSYELAMIDVLLIPLELNNPFCDAKSPLKWFESAIAGTPAVCAANPTYSALVRDGVNGFLCSSPDDWEKAIASLCESPLLRNKISKQAALDAEKFSLRSTVAPVLQLLASIKDATDTQSLSLDETS